MLQQILQDLDVTLVVKREDLLFPGLGNKYYKLKYNLEDALRTGHDTVLTFGGAFSNHIAAVAAMGKEFGIETIGVIRGQELIPENPTLARAAQNGMRFHFVSREDYRQKSDPTFTAGLESRFGKFYHLPEGGTNPLAVKGAAEILTQDTAHFDYICCAVGTGGTLSGLIESSTPKQQILGFPVVNDASLATAIRSFTDRTNWRLITDYTFGGYGKISFELVDFMNRFYRQTQIPTDPVYTSKLFFGVMDMIRSGYFEKGSTILMVHTGGLQGVEGMNIRLQKMNLPTIEYV